MPYARETLAQLQTQVAGDIASAAQGSDALLRFANLKVIGKVQAGMANLHYGYLDWISKMAVPFTAEDEYLQGWAALKAVFLQTAQVATGQVTYNGQTGTPLPSGTAFVRGDGVTYTTTSAGIVGAGGTVTVSAAATPDPTGQTGAIGNMDAGTVVTLSQSINGIQSNGTATSGWANGSDIETDDSLRNRMLAAYQQSPAGGNKTDYENWAKQVPGVTRAWCVPYGFGVGTLVVYVMMDTVNAAEGGFPQGTTGVATADRRGVAATGDQLTVANALFMVQASVGLVYVASPTNNNVTLAISGLPTALQTSATEAVAGLLLTEGTPGGTIPYENVWQVVNSVAGGNFFTLTPATDIVSAPGQLPTLQTINYS